MTVKVTVTRSNAGPVLPHGAPSTAYRSQPWATGLRPPKYNLLSSQMEKLRSKQRRRVRLLLALSRITKTVILIKYKDKGALELGT